MLNYADISAIISYDLIYLKLLTGKQLVFSKESNTLFFIGAQLANQSIQMIKV
jgi:hypothetical protein